MKHSDKERRVWLTERILFFCGELLDMRREHVPDYETFRSLNYAQYTYVVCVTQIGELANRYDSEFTGLYGDIPWKEIIAMRNMLVHEYHRLQLDILWETGENDIPYIQERFGRILKDLTERDEDEENNT